MRKIQSLKVLHIGNWWKCNLIGHIEHGDTQCDGIGLENPTSGLFMLKMMTEKGSFENLETLYLE